MVTSKQFFGRYSLCAIISLLIVLCVSGLIKVQAAETESSWPYANETKQQRDTRMEWWRQARFGMFIHWGVYSVPAGTYKDKQIDGIGEWIMNRGKIPIAEYKKFAKQFNPLHTQRNLTVY